MSGSDLAGHPRKLTVGDVSYDVYPLTLADLGKLEAWLQSRFPDPFQVVNEAIGRGDYTVPQQQFLLAKALDKATGRRIALGTPEADGLMQSIEGVKQLLMLSIRKGKPEFSEAEAEQLWSAMGLGDLEAVFAVTGVNLVAQ